MTQKKRRSLDENNDLAAEFVYGAPPKPPERSPDPEPEPEEEDEPPPPPPTKPRKPTKPQAKAKPSLKERLMNTTEKEPTVRLTVDMPQSMHRKLSLLCAETGQKKADVVRMLLEEAFKELED